MTRLLVSVRTLDEALLAAAAGVDLIDVKEPARGPLGMADTEVRRAIGEQLGTRYLLSAACGELFDFSTNQPGSLEAGVWDGYRYAKIGMVGCEAFPHWREEWLAWSAELPRGIKPVLVCYADGKRCGAPCFEDLRDFAIKQRIGTLLFDTWDKRGPGLCELWPAAELLRIGQALQQDGIEFVLAGKLVLDNVPALAKCGASYLGIRGAVCDAALPGDDIRCGKLNAAKMKNFVQFLITHSLDMPYKQAPVDS